jgi:hypothetical protein
LNQALISFLVRFISHCKQRNSVAPEKNPTHRGTQRGNVHERALYPFAEPVKIEIAFVEDTVVGLLGADDHRGELLCAGQAEVKRTIARSIPAD